jgi:phytanoyl-CoA hydroxylase
VTTFWFAARRRRRGTTVAYGPSPAGHRGPLRERFVRDGEQLALEVLDRTPWPDQRTAVPLPCEAGR